MKTKTFDCVEMKRRGAAYVYGIIKEMTPEEEVEFWRKQTEEMRREQERLREGLNDVPKVQTKRMRGLTPSNYPYLFRPSTLGAQNNLAAM